MVKANLLLGSAALSAALLGLSAASAADLPTRKEAPVYVAPVPVYNWTGFYLGANLGASFSNGSTNIVGSPAFLTAIVNPLGIPTSGYGNNAAGFFGGAQAGYNYQINQAVIGAETDMQWMSANPHGTSVSAGVLPGVGTVTTSVSARMNWLGTTRLRAGFLPMDRFLLYVTGGLAYGGGSYNASITGTGGGRLGRLEQRLARRLVDRRRRRIRDHQQRDAARRISLLQPRQGVQHHGSQRRCRRGVPRRVCGDQHPSPGLVAPRRAELQVLKFGLCAKAPAVPTAGAFLRSASGRERFRRPLRIARRPANPPAPCKSQRRACPTSSPKSTKPSRCSTASSPTNTPVLSN